MHRLIALVFMAACAGGAGSKDRGDGGEETGETDLPDTDVPTIVDTDTPTDTDPEVTVEPLDAASIAALEETIARFAVEAAALDFAPVRVALDQLAGVYEDPYCPEFYDGPLGRMWNEDCVTPDGGYRLFGIFVTVTVGWDAWSAALGDALVEPWGAQVEPGWTRPAQDPLPTGDAYMAACTATRGARLVHLNGFYHDLQADWSGITLRQYWAEGPVTAPGLDPDSWAERGLDPNLIRTVLAGASGGRLWHYQGAIASLDAPWDTVWVDQLVLGNAAASDPCVSEALGTLAVRDPDGFWFDLVFDGDTGGDCDGCGQLTLAGQPVGTACPDLSPLMTEDAP